MNFNPNDPGFAWNWKRPFGGQMASRLRYETHGSSRKKNPRFRVPDIYLAAPSKVDIVLSETEQGGVLRGARPEKMKFAGKKIPLRSIRLMVIRLTSWGWYSLSRYLQGFIHLKWCRISSINGIVHRSMQSPRLYIFFSACEVMIRRMNNDMLTLLTSVHVLIMHTT